MAWSGQHLRYRLIVVGTELVWLFQIWGYNDGEGVIDLFQLSVYCIGSHGLTLPACPLSRCIVIFRDSGCHWQARCMGLTPQLPIDCGWTEVVWLFGEIITGKGFIDLLPSDVDCIESQGRLNPAWYSGNCLVNVSGGNVECKNRRNRRKV